MVVSYVWVFVSWCALLCNLHDCMGMGNSCAAFAWYTMNTTGLFVYVSEITETQSGQLCKCLSCV